MIKMQNDNDWKLLKILPSFTTMCFVFVLTLVNSVNAQIQTVPVLPERGFAERIRAEVDSIWIIDTHEHLETEEARINRAAELDFTHLFRHYALEDLTSASNSYDIIGVIFGNDFAVQERWQLFEPYFSAMRTTGYGRVPLIAANDLYGIPDINSETFEELSHKIRQVSKPGLYKDILKKKARIDLSIQDGGHRQFDHKFFRHVERFDDFVMLSSASAVAKIAQQTGTNIQNLDDYLAALRKAFIAGIKRKMVGIKSALAYNRTLDYSNCEPELAQRLFAELLDGQNLSFAALKSLQDYIMHRLIDLAEEFDLPVQIHTGLQAGNGNIITNSKPTHLTNLIMIHPRVDFCLFHGGYPYGGELAVLAKNFPNVYIDMCWSAIISPSYSKRYLHEWIETVPANKILAFGGDYSVVELVYAHSVMARRIVAEVLIEKVESGYLSEEEAIAVARRILRQNALEVFRMQGQTRKPDSLAVLKRPGNLQQWWQIHRSPAGFIRNWMVIGPFEFGGGLDDILPPEQNIDLQAEYSGRGEKVQWQRVTTRESGELNFLVVFQKNAKIKQGDLSGMAYACAEFKSPREKDIKLSLGSNDGAKIWLNDKVIYNRHLGRRAFADNEFLDIHVKKGWNRLLVKVENLGASWGLYVRLIDPDDEIEIREF
ncbi:MAG: hypothetical protein DWQ10_10265 [Calditrichaeota bacterium]|nr:MAG: hypothetical protein DWQ10_10265 [Calditrichota bacterium]